jgi:hypothetical protein
LDVVMAGGAVERLRATVAGLGSGGGRRWALDESVEMAMADWIGLNSGHGAENEELT